MFQVIIFTIVGHSYPNASINWRAAETSLTATQIFLRVLAVSQRLRGSWRIPVPIAEDELRQQAAVTPPGIVADAQEGYRLPALAPHPQFGYRESSHSLIVLVDVMGISPIGKGEPRSRTRERALFDMCPVPTRGDNLLTLNGVNR